jgi:hypothetical protein
MGYQHYASLRQQPNIPSPNTVNLNVDPPDAWNAQHAPQVRFTKRSRRWRPLYDGQPDYPSEADQWYPDAEQEL